MAWGATIEDGRPTSVALLRRRLKVAAGIKVRLLTEVQLPGMPAFADCLSAAGDGDGRRFDELLDALGPWQVLRLMGVRAGSPWLSLAPTRIVALSEPEGGVAVLDTSVAFDECWAAVSKSVRTKVGQMRRKIGTGSSVTVAIGPDVAAAYDDFLVLESAGWKGDGGTALAQAPGERDLLRDYLLAEAGAEIRSLWIDGRLAASQVVVKTARTLFLFKIAYDEGLAALAPGNLLLANLLESCCADPSIDRIDFLNWQPWFGRWGAVREPTYQVVAFNHRSVLGALAGIGWNVVRNPRMQFAYAWLRDAYRRPKNAGAP